MTETTSPVNTQVTLENRLNDASITEFKAQLRGNLISPDDPGYDEARRLYNAMIDKRPALIARCTDVADVIAAVNFGRDNGLAVAVRGGGHNGPGLALVNDGLVIDLSLMKGVHVNQEARTVQVEGGCVWGDVDHATHPFGMAVPSGFISSTGVGGLTLGGGVGYLTRQFGLTIDNLLAVEMVLADGRVVEASASSNPDLFWAVRGGGGNFGVVTSFLFKLSPVSTVYGGPIFWPMEQAPEVMKGYRDIIMSGQERSGGAELNGWFGFHYVPPVPMFPEEHHLKKVCVVTWCYTGDPARADEVFKPIRELGTPLMDFAGPIPWPVLQSLFDFIYPPGLQWYWRTDFVKDLPDEAIKKHIEYAEQLPTGHSTMHLYPTNGAAHRVRSDETAWSYRDVNFIQVIVGVDPDPANNTRMIQWARSYWEALHPYSAGGGYVNMMMEEGEDRVKAAYRGNYERLAQVKGKYDPTNVFHVNQNIKPTA